MKKNDAKKETKNNATRLKTVFAVLFFAFLFQMPVNAQDTGGITIERENISVNEALDIVRAQGGKFVMYENRLVETRPNITLNLRNATLENALTAICSQANLRFEILDEHILLTDAGTAGGQRQVSGRITDDDGNPLPGATIRLKGSQRGTFSDTDGNYTILVAPNDVLVYTFVGMQEQEMLVGNRNRIDVTIYPDVNVLDEFEVVSTGYQQVSRERTTASYGFVNNVQLNKQINVDLLSALEGQVAGMSYVKNPTGKSADSPVIRGIGTFSSDVGTAPLIVVDDLPTNLTLDELNPYDVESITVLKDAAASSIYGARAANGVIVVTSKKAKNKGTTVSVNADWFLTMKPDMSKMHYATTSQMIDFETDVYNAELARYADTESMFNYYGGIGNGTIRYYSPLYQLYRDQASGALSESEVSATINRWRNNDYIRDFRNHVWQVAATQRYNLSLSNNSEWGNNYFSLNYENDKGRLIHTKNERFNLYYKSAYDIGSRLTATVGINASYRMDEEPESSYDDYRLQPRYARIVDDNGNGITNSYVDLGSIFSSGVAVNALVAQQIAENPALKSTEFNLLESLAETTVKNRTLNLRPFVNLQFKIYRDLTYQAMFQYELTNSERKRYDDADSYAMRMAHNSLVSYNSATDAYTSNLPAGGRFYQLRQTRNTYTFRQQLNFDKTFGPEREHILTAIGGFEMRQTRTPSTIEELRYGYDPITLTSSIMDWAVASQTGYTSYIYGSRSTLSALGRSQTEIRHRYVSLYGNAGYTFLGKYNLTASIRVDQADLFGVDPKYKYRPLWSVGAAWNIGNEPFMADVEWIDRLKVRATYGVNGNVDQTSSPFLVARRRNDNLFAYLQYLDITTLPNPKLRWEKTETSNFGVDFAVLKNRLHGSVDLYNRYSSDLLVTTDLDPTVGASSRVLNNGALLNRGVEVSLGGDIFRSKDWQVSANLVLANNHNKVKKVNRAVTSAYSYISAPSNYFFENEAYNSLYAYRFSRMVNGYPVFFDENGDENVDFDADGNPTAVRSINSTDAIVLKGQLLPTYNGSFSLRAQYKFVELSAMLVFAGGNHLRKDVTSLSDNDVMDEDITRRWSAGGTGDLPRLYVDYPQAQANYASTLSTLWQYADVHVKKADYAKLRNVSLSVYLPQKLTNAMRLGSTKFTAQVNNLFTWSMVGDDIDPESFSLNSGTRNVPIPRTFLFGFSTTF